MRVKIEAETKTELEKKVEMLKHNVGLLATIKKIEEGFFMSPCGPMMCITFSLLLTPVPTSDGSA